MNGEQMVKDTEALRDHIEKEEWEMALYLLHVLEQTLAAERSRRSYEQQVNERLAEEAYGQYRTTGSSGL